MISHQTCASAAKTHSRCSKTRLGRYEMIDDVIAGSIKREELGLMFNTMDSAEKDF